MFGVAINTYQGDGLVPVIYPDLARTDAVVLAPGTYVAGQVLGQITTLTTANDVQTLTVSATSGTFVVGFNGANTAALSFDVTAAQLQAALRALSTINGAYVTVTGGPGATNPLVATFGGLMGNKPQPAFLTTTNSLVGGSTSATWVHTTTGRVAGGVWGAYVTGASDGTDVARGVLKYACTVDGYGRVTAGGGQWGTTDYTAVAYIAGYFRTADLTSLDAAAIADFGHIVEGSATNLTNTGTIIKIH